MRRLIVAGLVALGAAPGVAAAADLASVQRGYAVYAQVCSACHSLKQLTYADLGDLGLTSAQVKALATSNTVTDGIDATGQPSHRAARPDDHLPSPFPNEPRARAANNGALPPDMSRLALTLDGHENAIERLLTGYAQAPDGVAVPPGSYYNAAAPGGLIAMPPPLHDGQVAFTDGTRPTARQMAHDVAAFLGWVAHPHLEQRHRIGVSVVLYVALLTLLLFLLKRRIWTHVD